MKRLVAGFVGGVLFVMSLILAAVIKEMSTEERLPSVDPEPEYFPFQYSDNVDRFPHNRYGTYS